MKAGRHKRVALVATGSILAFLTIAGPRAQARAHRPPPLTAADFQQAAPRGLGDRNNSWAQSMVWWRNHLYVGTGRQASCTALFSIWQFVSILVSLDFANTWFPYPPHDPDLVCAPDGADLSLQAEIWRWTPDDDAWERVFQSPLDLDNPGTGPPAPPRTGKKLPYEITIRGMAPHTDPDGTEALYAFGVNSTVMWDRNKLPPPRILRSTDGLTFTPVPQTPGTFLGDLPFNPDHSSFRSPVSYNGKLFVLCGPVFGQGTLIASADPAKGDDAWFLAGPANLMFYEMEKFNGWLYLGTFNPQFGYAIMKTRAEGTPPYKLITVVPRGAYLAYRPSRSVVSMHVYQGRLWVGTATMTEVIRINPDDTWDLVVGTPRVIPLPHGHSEWRYPTSNLDAGWGHTLNDHAWQMDAPYGELYIGTYNASIGSKNDPVNAPLLLHNMGAHLYHTRNGWYHTAVTTNGFTNPDDPHGGRFDYGIRTISRSPFGTFFGTVNDFYGLAVFRASSHPSKRPDPPDRLDIEPTTSGSALLSWRASPGAASPVSYQVWRAQILPILVRDDVNFEAWNGAFGNKIPDTYVTEYQHIGTSPETFFVDSSVEPDKRYMYYVVVDTGAQSSEQSNLVTFPVLRPPMTFAELGQEFESLDQRGRFRLPASRVAQLRGQIAEAQTLAADCDIDAALGKLDPRRASMFVRKPEAADVEVLMSKLVRRLEMFELLPDEVISDEFCTPALAADAVGHPRAR